MCHIVSTSLFTSYNFNLQDQWTPLMQACQDGNTGLVELLVEKGANTELFNPVSLYGYNALFASMENYTYAEI